MAVSLFFAIAVFNNVIDYQNTFAFTHHTLSMDTTSQNPHFMGRAILNPFFQHAMFISIIVIQFIVASLCGFSAVRMLFVFKNDFKFTQAKAMALIGCCLGFVLYGLGFMTVAGQWFMMRESTAWNVQNSVQLFLIFLGFSLLYLHFPEKDR